MQSNTFKAKGGVMAKSEFKRGLSSETLPAVKSFLETELGQSLNNNNSFQICIRDEYINVYYNGCSILKFTPNTGKYEIHHKYTKEPKSKLYIELKWKDNDLIFNDFSLNDLINEPDLYVGPYFCGEKKYLAQYLKSHQAPVIIDLEVAYTCRVSTTKKRDFVAKRIDLAVIENGKLRLIEVKIDTDSRLRSDNDGDQEILGQMKSYREFIKEETPNIIASYKTIAQNILDLDLIHKMGGTPKFTIDNLSAFIANNDCFDPDPGLLVVETGKNKNGKNNVKHWNRLLSQFEQLGVQSPRTWDAQNLDCI